MPTRTYKIRSISRRGTEGITQPSLGTLDAVIKFDSGESSQCVYNEYVALRLAQTLHVPVADGVLGISGDGPQYASLQLSSPGMRLPNALESQWARIAAEYPLQAAALFAFDVLIGNADRYSNFKAAVVTPHLKLFAAFDHSHALLGLHPDTLESIRRLGTLEPIVRSHPFRESSDPEAVFHWAQRMADLPDVYYHECCVFGRPLRTVTEDLQEVLAEALIHRKNHLVDLVVELHPELEYGDEA